MQSPSYTLRIGRLARELPLFEVQPGLHIAVLNILGDVELAEEAAAALAPRIAVHTPQVLMTPEAKSIPLAYALARRLHLPYVVLRKTYKSYMGEALSATTTSITMGREQTLYLDQKDRDLVANARVALIDDVISTGSTLVAMHEIVTRAAGEAVCEAAICTEGELENWKHVIALAHLPLFKADGKAVDA
ncbi:MAG: adenine phosphoribosyltransferase [Gammaproteobacteria bacterium]|nr:adenine phosphoribosyltransferase [Gammaproteobacteria bacterium]MDE2274132.1 adenine phosphoribosyltransferase [Gammaproteobacteria bacterium]